jgi:hypothetical protein
MPHNILVIVGMHRSGTSLITNWLEKCGLEVGERLEAATPSNLDGHFEDLEFKIMHEEVLTSKNLPASGLVEVHDVDLSVYQTEKLKSIINVKNNLYDQWGWKDPRTCLFLDTYRQLLPGSKYLVILRDYQSVIDSLLRRDFLEIDKRRVSRHLLSKLIWNVFRRRRQRQTYYKRNAEHYLKVWLAYNEEILRMVKNIPAGDYIVTNCGMLEKKDTEIFNFLTQNWHFKLTYFSFKNVFKKSLMNSVKNMEDFIQDKVLIAKADYVETRLKSLVAYN